MRDNSRIRLTHHSPVLACTPWTKKPLLLATPLPETPVFPVKSLVLFSTGDHILNLAPPEPCVEPVAEREDVPVVLPVCRS